MYVLSLTNDDKGLSVRYFLCGSKEGVGLKGRLHSLYLKFHSRGTKLWSRRDITVNITAEAAILFLKMSHMALKTKQIIKFRFVQTVKT